MAAKRWASGPASSTTPSRPAPTAFLQDRDARAQELLAQSPGDSLSVELRARIKDHINEVFDFAELSRLALGDCRTCGWGCAGRPATTTR